MKLLILFAFFGVALATTPKFNLPISPKTLIKLQHAAKNFKDMKDEQIIETVNEFVDVVTSEVGQLMVTFGFDPLALPDVHQNIELNRTSGQLDLWKGWLSGISSLYRGGEVEVFYEDRKMTVNAPINFHDFTLVYEYAARILGYELTGIVTGQVLDISIFASVEIDFNDYLVYLVDFQITNLGEIEVTFEGGGMGNWILNQLTETFIDIFKGIIQTVAETIVKENLLKLIDFVNQIIQFVLYG